MRPVKALSALAGKLVESRRFLGTLVLILALVTVFIATSQAITDRNQAQRDKQIADCQSRYNQALALNITVRASLTDQERQASKLLNEGTFAFIKGVVTPTPNLTQAQKVARFERLSAAYITMFARYTQTEAKIDSERAAHPVPKLSIRACV